MLIALAGFRGFIGTHFRSAFSEHEFICLERSDLYGEAKNLSKIIENADIVINLAGYTVSKRWTKKTREKIKTSRIDLTRNLVEAINGMHKKPQLFLNASAIGIYEYNKEHTEESNSYGNDFLAEIVKEWEGTTGALSKEVKTINIRLGLVLGNDGGALPRLIKLFKTGLGGNIGSGKQVYSFIHIEDVVHAMMYLITNQSQGIYNFTAPNPVTNKVFTKTLARQLKRPSIFIVPEFAMKLLMGKAASIVTQGQTVYPKRLLDEGYKFNFASIESAIENLVSRK